MITAIDGVPAGQHVLARHLEAAGFVLSAAGFQMRRLAQMPEPVIELADDDDA